MDLPTPVLLTTSELVLWSAGAGAIGLLVLLTAVDLLLNRRMASLQAVLFLFASLLLLALTSGLASTLVPGLGQGLHIAQVVIGPLCAGMSSFWIGGWLSSNQRDRVAMLGFRCAAALSLAGGLLSFALPHPAQLPAAAAVTALNTGIVLWLVLRAAQGGDRLAWGLVASCVLNVPMALGLYWLVIDPARWSLPIQVLLALMGLLSLGITATMLWLRRRQQQQLERPQSAQLDPVTQLLGSIALVNKIIKTLEQNTLRSRHGMLLAVLVFEPERLIKQIGHHGLNDLYAQLARRLQRDAGVVNPVGRYYDSCLMVLVETVHSPRWMRTLGLRVSASMREPVVVTSLGGERIQVRLDVGIGVTPFAGAGCSVEQLLDNVQGLARVARSMASRAAAWDPAARQPVPLDRLPPDSNWRPVKPPATLASKRSGAPRRRQFP